MKVGAGLLHTTSPLSLPARLPPVPDLPRFYVTRGDYAPAPYAVRDRHVMHTLARFPTREQAEAYARHEEDEADWSRTRLRDDEWFEERAVVRAERNER